jgi:excisionase family DNA binding protein
MSEVRVRSKVDNRVVYKVSEVAEMLDVDVPMIYRHIRAGSLVVMDTRVPGSPKPHWRISRESLDAFLAAAAKVGALALAAEQQ